MLFFLLKLLGIGKFILDFVKDNWKICVPIILGVVAFIMLSKYYYNKGIIDERTAWEHRIAEETAKNNKLTNSLSDLSINYGLLARKENEDRVAKETIYEKRLNTIIQEKPIYKDCVVDQEVLDNLNAIRSLYRQ